ncbi:hypothetical protein [Embleya sp. AB8]|uniref:hypothetical protein n=1 Tax=Embleya sp. AB8 TaxID=3156304 RepID=UPI003C784AF7
MGTLVGLLVESFAAALVGARAGEGGAGRGVLCVVLDTRVFGDGAADRVEEPAAELRAAGGHVPGTGEQPPPDDAVLTVRAAVWARLADAAR